MSSAHATIAAAAAAWIAMTFPAAAEPPARQADIPSGDVWVTPDAPRVVPSQAARNEPDYRQLPTGDFWPAEETVTRAAETPAPPLKKSAWEEVATGK